MPSMEIPDQPAKWKALEKKNPGRHFSFRMVISLCSGRSFELPIASGRASGISVNQDFIKPRIETEAVSKEDGLG